MVVANAMCSEPEALSKMSSNKRKETGDSAPESHAFDESSFLISMMRAVLLSAFPFIAADRWTFGASGESCSFTCVAFKSTIRHNVTLLGLSNQPCGSLCMLLRLHTQMVHQPALGGTGNWDGDHTVLLYPSYIVLAAEAILSQCRRLLSLEKKPAEKMTNQFIPSFSSSFSRALSGTLSTQRRLLTIADSFQQVPSSFFFTISVLSNALKLCHVYFEVPEESNIVHLSSMQIHTNDVSFAF